MQIECLKLTNFRNYSDINIEFGKNINIFIGDNGQGKTNILESIYILSISKSNRYGDDNDLIQFGKDFTVIEGVINNNIIKKQKVVISKSKKSLYINNKEIKKNRDYISNFCVISFVPVDLEIIKGSPNVRRNLLNVDISQLYNNYINYLNEYNSILKVRNDYLKKININGYSDIRYLDVISKKLVEKADKIYEYRFNFIKMINCYLPKIYKKITGLGNLYIKFDNNLGIDDYSPNIVDKIFSNKLKKSINVELMQGMTVCGPHRDDFSFQLNGIDMKTFASQGQQRIAVIALKISEIYIFKDVLGEYPVLLLDDIFSEIDIKKRNKIVEFLENDIQVIVTTTDIDNINDKLLKNANVYKINRNRVIKKGKIKNGRK